MSVEQPERPGASHDAGLNPRWARLAAFIAPRLEPGEEVRAVLSRSGNPNSLIDVLATFVSLYGLADAISTHRAVVVTDRHVFIVRMPWLRSWSVELLSDLDDVAVIGFEPGSLPAGGLLFTPGNISLRFSEGRQVDLGFGVDGSDMLLLRAEAEAVATAIGAPRDDGDARYLPRH